MGMSTWTFPWRKCVRCLVVVVVAHTRVLYFSTELVLCVHTHTFGISFSAKQKKRFYVI
jgi:hypothetical protein